MKVIWAFILLVFFAAVMCIPAFGADYPALERQRWEKATVNPRSVREIDSLLAIFERNKSRYEAVSKYGKQGIPPIVIFCLHYRESDNSFRCHASNGDPLDHRTYHVPRGRLFSPSNPPFKWGETAIDAYYIYDKLGNVNWNDIGSMLFACESFNGIGNLSRGRFSSYIWSMTSEYTRGKYVDDGKYDPLFVDQQIGCAAIFKRYYQLHPKAGF